MKTGPEDAAEADAGARRLRREELRDRARVGHGEGRRPGAGVARLPRRLPQGRHGADAAVRLRLVRPVDGSELPLEHPLAARPRLRLRDRAHPRRRGDGPRLVRERQEAQEEEHVHRLHRGDRDAGRAGLRREGQGVHGRRQRRRPADGRRRQHAPGPVSRRRRAGAVRRRRHDDARREHPADDQRVRRVGQPEDRRRTTTTCCRIRRTTT